MDRERLIHVRWKKMHMLKLEKGSSRHTGTVVVVLVKM